MLIGVGTFAGIAAGFDEKADTVKVGLALLAALLAGVIGAYRWRRSQ